EIRKAGEEASIRNGVMFLFEDMSGGFKEAADRSRDMGMYRQSYCGCVYSEKERYQKNDPPVK
ncbi:MAG: epoxyqueuosine reductase QueH, partial [Actinobacteria bacterium]|nr:epoxyqueuosine reductase QueH [Actinomycetota bacterium]